MASQYKLIYFDRKGTAEVSRLLFVYGGMEYEDIRVKSEEWSQVKNNFVFGQVPVLEHNGKQVGQSRSIARYVAKKVNLAGNDDWEDLEIDAIVDTVADIYYSKITPIFFEHDEEKRKDLCEKAVKDTFPYYLPRLEAVAKQNNGHLSRSRLTWADFYFANIAPRFDLITGDDALATYPYLEAVVKNVFELPSVKKWNEARAKN